MKTTDGAHIVTLGQPLPLIWQGPAAFRKVVGPVSGRPFGQVTGRSLAREPYPQVPQWHPRVAKHSSDRSSARRPSTEALLGQGRVPKERESLPLQGLWSSLRPGLARHPRLQVVLRQGRVTKGTSIGTLARRPYPQMPQWHPRGATVSWCIG